MKSSYTKKMQTRTKVLFALVALVAISASRSLGSQAAAAAAEDRNILGRTMPKLENLFAIMKQASRQGASYMSDLLVSIPFGKIALASGALLSLFFLFLRLLIVLGPILLLGAMTRESTEATDVLRMLMDFYNQIIVTLDEQMPTPNGYPNPPQPLSQSI